MTRKRKKLFLNNQDLVTEIIESKNQNKMTDKLAQMIMLLVQRYSKSPQFIGYSYRDDMESFATMMLVQNWHKFDESRSSNAFAFFTQCAKNSFIHYLKLEKKHRNIRDELLVREGLYPSNSFQLDHELEGEKTFIYGHSKPTSDAPKLRSTDEMQERYELDHLEKDEINELFE